MKPLEDGTNVHNILALQVPMGSNPRAQIAFTNQFAPLNLIEDDVTKVDKETKSVRKHAHNTIEMLPLTNPPTHTHTHSVTLGTHK